MTVTVLLFAGARVAAGSSTLAVDLSGRDDRPATVAYLRSALAAACPALGPMLPHCRVAVAAAYADDHDPIPPGAEVALIPPVSGGAT